MKLYKSPHRQFKVSGSGSDDEKNNINEKNKENDNKTIKSQTFLKSITSDVNLIKDKNIINNEKFLKKITEKRIPEKKSVGILCRRYNSKRELEIMLVCRRCTYAFDMFMQGSYNTNNNEEILTLLNSMTTDEKIILLSLDFDIVWYFWWLNGSVRSKHYFELQTKYQKIIIDKGIRLRKLIEKSSNGTKIWEIPKGRRECGEKMIHGAIREFEEETGMKKADYRFSKKSPIQSSFVDCGIRYTTTYFVADAIKFNNIKVQFSKETLGEICEVRWMTLNEIKTIDQFARIEKMFNDVKK
jgi:8-oxo-dGTP pyrophosphatase MutT (NUDIX family)